MRGKIKKEGGKSGSSSAPRSKKIGARYGRKRNKTEQKEEKFLPEPLKKILPSQHPVLKPVSLPDY
jgi:hypothetical protein